MKRGLDTFAWHEVAAMRISFSFISTLPLLIFYFRKLKRSEFPYYCMVGLFGSGIPAFCFTFAQTHIESGVTGVLNSLTPVFTFLIGVLFFRLAFDRRKMLGLFIALTGALLLVAFESPESGTNNLLYALPVFAATISYAISANIVKRFLQNAHPVALGAAGFSFIGIPSLIYLLTTGFWEKSGTETFQTSLYSIIALAVFGTVIASLMFYAIIQKTDPVFGSLVSYLIPVVAIILGVADGERLVYTDYAGIILILAGIYFVNSTGRIKEVK